MSYKVPNNPSPEAHPEELADFWEVQAILRPDQFFSRQDVKKVLNMGLDELNHDGISSEEDKLETRLEHAFDELFNRQGYTNNTYPFTLKRSSIKLNENESFHKNLYIYLLLCTRFKMSDLRVQNQIDGTLLFERLCTTAASNYFCVDSNSSYVFGTASKGNFETKVRELIEKLGEGESFTNPEIHPPTKNDAGVDVVAWKDFADRKPGKLIAFCQCKTGTNWKDSIHKLKPTLFCQNWFYKNPIISPIPVVFLTDTLKALNFYTDQREFLMFDRFRVMEYLTVNVPTETQAEVNSWVKGAVATLNSF